MTEKSKRKSSTVWIIILAILAVPVGIPLALGLGAGLIGLIIGLGAAAVAVVVAAGTAILAGIIAIVTFPIAIFTDFGTAMANAGGGMVAIGIGILLVMCMVSLLKAVFGLVKKSKNKIVGGKNDGQQHEQQHGHEQQQTIQ